MLCALFLGAPLIGVVSMALAAALCGGIVSTPAFAAPATAGIDIPYTQFTLPNGLRVIVHTDRKALITDLLSTLVLEATGPLILRESSAPAGPVLWLNHDIVARQLNQLHA